MTQEEFGKISYASHEIIKLADDLISKLEVNRSTIEERKISNAAISTMTSELTSLVSGFLNELRTGDASAEQKLARVTDFLGFLVSSMQSNQRSLEDELVRLVATQDGMRRALDAVRETASMRLNELARIDELSQLQNPEARRSVGDRPETITTKRNAKSLKRDREVEDT
jgi:hypothetical protein